MDRQCATKQFLRFLTLLLMIGSGLAWAESQQAEHSKGLTVEDLARGLRGAAQNIEKEIPKMGAAVGKAVKSIGGNSSEKTRSQKPPADKK